MNEIDNLLKNFDEHFREKFAEVKQLEHLVEGFTDVEIGRCVLLIAARDFEPLSNPVKDLLERIRRAGF